MPTASGQGTVKLGDIGAWSNVGPEYRDYIGDANLRSVAGMYAGYTYVDNTARNDFSYAKVSQDSDYLYFMVECANNIEIDDGANWMNLFINIDNDATTGWEGYDFVLNRRTAIMYPSNPLQTVGGEKMWDRRCIRWRGRPWLSVFPSAYWE